MPRLPEHRKTCHTIQLEEQAPITEATQGTHSTASELLVYMPQHSQENQAYMQSGPQQNIIQMRRDIEHNPHKYLSNASMGVQASASGMQASASQPPNPYRAQGLSSFVLQVAGMLRVPASIGWCRTQNIHSYIMPVVFTLSTFFFLCLFDTLIRRPDHVITITTHHF